MASSSAPQQGGEPPRPAGRKKQDDRFPACLRDPEFRKLLYRLARGQPADREDIVQQVLLKLTEWCADETKRTPEEMRKYGAGILKKLLALHARKTGKARERTADTSPEEHGAREHPAKMDPVDIDRALARLDLGEGAANDKALIFIEVLRDEKTWEEVAKEHGGTAAAWRKGGERWRDKARSTWARHGITYATLVGAVVLLVVAGGLHVAGVTSQVEDRVSRWIHPRAPLEHTPTKQPGPKGEREVDRRIEDAEDALRKGDIARCNQDTEAARFLGGGDAVRLGEVTRKCLEASERRAPPEPSASVTPPAPSASAPRRAPAPRPGPTAPDSRRLPMSLDPLR